MAKIDVVDLKGKKVGTLELADEVFGGINEDLLWEAVQHYRAARRAGTHATKNKKLVSGAGKKLWKQKGTGRARVGSIRRGRGLCLFVSTVFCLRRRPVSCSWWRAYQRGARRGNAGPLPTAGLHSLRRKPRPPVPACRSSCR